MTTTALRRTVEVESSTRRIVIGALFILLGAVIVFLFGRGLEPGAQTTFGLTAGGSEVKLSDWVLNTSGTLRLLGVLSIAIGGFKLVRGFHGWTNRVLALASGQLDAWSGRFVQARVDTPQSLREQAELGMDSDARTLRLRPWGRLDPLA